jgi:sortase A
VQASFVTPPTAGRGRGRLALLADGLRRPGGRRALSLLSVVLLLAGVGLFAFPFATDIYQRHLQGNLRNQFDDSATANAYRTHTFREGQGLTRLEIPTIGLDVLVVQGTTTSALRAGAGHYVGTPLPGEAGNVSIAGHRTTFGHPFNRLDEVKPGQLINLFTPDYEFTYQSAQSFTSATTYDGTVNPHPVKPTDISVIAPPTDPTVHELTLTTCNPKGSAAQRLILRAVLVKVTDAPGSTKPLPNIHAPASRAPQSSPSVGTLPGPS